MQVCLCINADVVREDGKEPYCRKCGHWWITEHGSKVPGAAVATAPRQKVGRNDPCPCGSGLKFKRCCFGKSNPSPWGMRDCVCGSRRVLCEPVDSNGPWQWRAHCSDCGRGELGVSREAAVKGWNAATPTKTGPEIEAAKRTEAGEKSAIVPRRRAMVGPDPGGGPGRLGSGPTWRTPAKS